MHSTLIKEGKGEEEEETLSCRSCRRSKSVIQIETAKWKSERASNNNNNNNNNNSNNNNNNSYHPFLPSNGNQRVQNEQERKRKKIKNRHWLFIALLFPFFFSFILCSVACSEARKSGGAQQQSDHNMCLLVFE